MKKLIYNSGSSLGSRWTTWTGWASLPSPDCWTSSSRSTYKLISHIRSSKEKLWQLKWSVKSMIMLSYVQNKWLICFVLSKAYSITIFENYIWKSWFKLVIIIVVDDVNFHNINWFCYLCLSNVFLFKVQHRHSTTKNFKQLRFVFILLICVPGRVQLLEEGGERRGDFGEHWGLRLRVRQ